MPACAQIALSRSDATCGPCRGVGTLDDGSLCRCVYRSIFRSCLNRCVYASTRRNNRGYPELEFRADFELTAKNTLSPEHYAIFRLHYWHGLDWRACIAQLGMNRQKFFRELHLMQESLGRTCLELDPHALYPTADYLEPCREYTIALPVRHPQPLY